MCCFWGHLEGVESLPKVNRKKRGVGGGGRRGLGERWGAGRKLANFLDWLTQLLLIFLIGQYKRVFCSLGKLILQIELFEYILLIYFSTFD